MANISENMANTLSIQSNHELYNSQMYLSISSYWLEQSLNGFAKLFKGQQQEELEHNQKIIDYVTDREGKIIVESIDAPDFEMEYLLQDPSALVKVAEKYLEVEQATTARLNEIAKMTLSEGDFQTFNFILSMLEIQTIEENEANEFLQKARMLGGNLAHIKIWNDELL